MSWTSTADALPKPDTWLMATLPGREYPALVRLRLETDEPLWETHPGEKVPLRGYTYWAYFPEAPTK